MYQLYLVKSGNKQIRFYNLPCSKVSRHIVLDFAPTNQIGMTLKYFRSGSNLKYLNVPNPKLDNFFRSYQIKKTRNPGYHTPENGLCANISKYLSNCGSRLFYGTNIVFYFCSTNCTGLNASFTLNKFPSLSFGTIVTTG